MSQYHYDIIHGSDEWHQIRCGRLTSTNTSAMFGTIKQGVNLCLEKRMELLYNQPILKPQFRRGLVGLEREQEVLAKLSFFEGIETAQCGFVTWDHDFVGDSPDGLLEDGTPVEIKSHDDKDMMIHKRTIVGGMPDEHNYQVHHHMIVTESDRCLFVSYDPRFEQEIYQEYVPLDKKLAKRIIEKWFRFWSLISSTEPINEKTVREVK